VIRRLRGGSADLEPGGAQNCSWGRNQWRREPTPEPIFGGQIGGGTLANQRWQNGTEWWYKCWEKSQVVHPIRQVPERAPKETPLDVGGGLERWWGRIKVGQKQSTTEKMDRRGNFCQINCGKVVNPPIALEGEDISGSKDCAQD